MADTLGICRMGAKGHQDDDCSGFEERKKRVFLSVTDTGAHSCTFFLGMVCPSKSCCRCPHAGIDGIKMAWYNSDEVWTMGEKFDQFKYQNQYTKEHYDVIRTWVPKEEHIKERIKPLADRDGISVSQWILRLIKERLERNE